MNTPRVVMQETKKAFRNLFKKKDIESAVAALSNLKGVGPAMASGNHRTSLNRPTSVGNVFGDSGPNFHVFFSFLEGEILSPVDELGAH